LVNPNHINKPDNNNKENNYKIKNETWNQENVFCFYHYLVNPIHFKEFKNVIKEEKESDAGEKPDENNSIIKLTINMDIEEIASIDMFTKDDDIEQ